MNEIEFLDGQRTIDRELGRAVLSSLPVGWADAKLDLQYTQQGDGSSQRVSLTRLDGTGVGSPSDDVLARARELFVLHKQRATGLKSATYRFTREADGGWHFDSQLSYAD